MDRGALELERLVEQFEIHYSSDGKSDRTVEWYNQALVLFRNWLTSEGMSARLEDLGDAMLAAEVGGLRPPRVLQ